MFLAAEILASVQLFDPSENHVKKAVTEVGRMQRNSKNHGFLQLLESLEKLFSNDSVFEMVRFMAIVASLTSMIIGMVLRLDELELQQSTDSSNGVGLVKLATSGVSHVLGSLIRPRFWFSSALLAVWVAGNWSALGRLIRRPGTMELVRSLAPLLRAAGATLSTTGPSYSGPLPLWAAAYGVAAVGRAASFFVYERLSVETVLAGSLKEFFLSGTTATLAARGTLLLEAWSFLSLLPCALRRRGLRRLTVPVLLLPIAAVMAGGPAAAALETHAAQAINRLTIACAGVSLVLVFMGGILSMFSLIFLMQLFLRIHKLEKIRI